MSELIAMSIYYHTLEEEYSASETEEGVARRNMYRNVANAYDREIEVVCNVEA